MDLRALPEDYVVEPSDWLVTQTNAETADKRLVLDLLSGGGIASGLDLTQQATPNMTLQLAAGVAYDPTGRRVNVPSTQTVNLAADSDGASTAVSSGNERYVGIYVRFKRTNSSPWTDPTGVTVYLTQTESFEVRVVAGAAAAVGTAVYPAAPSGDPILLGRVKITNGMTAVLTTDVRLVNVPVIHRPEDQYAAAVERYLEVSVADPPNMTVVVAAGKCVIDDVWYSYAGGTTSAFTAPSTNPRIDLVALDSAGSLVVVPGTEASTPARPPTKGVLPIAFITLAVGQTKITDAHVTDARPFLRSNTTVRRHYAATATASQTTFNLPFSYRPGSHSLTVVVDGLTLAESEYTETSGTVVTTAPMTGGEKVTIYAQESAPLETVALQQVTDTLSGLLMLGGCAVEDQGGGVRLYVDPVALCVIGNVSYRLPTGYDVAGSGLSSNTWYHAYLSVSGGGLVASVSSSVSHAPADDMTWRGDSGASPTHRFLTAARTDSGGTLLRFRRCGLPGAGGVVLYDRCALGATALNVLTAGTDNTWTTVSLSSFVPPHARQVLIEVEVAASAGNNAGAEVRTYGGSAGGVLTLTSETVTDAQTLRREAWVLCDGSQRLQYQRASGYAGAVTIRVLGYRD